MIKKIIFSMVLLSFVTLPATVFAKEISLYDSDGSPVVYIDTDDDLTIYLWKGKPVAYLESKGDYFSIYGFNGKHLGWFEEGIIWDYKGYAVGFIKGAVNKFTKFEPFKGFKQFKPFKSFQQLEPLKPVFKDKWSAIPLEIFLIMGRED
jgi:hypothetical protein